MPADRPLRPGQCNRDCSGTVRRSPPYRHRDDGGLDGQAVPGVLPGLLDHREQIRRHGAWPRYQPALLPNDGRLSRGSLGLYASHLPTVLKDEGPYGLIECHLARANPHWKDLAAGTEALMIFQGPEGYITPNWYASKTVHGKVVRCVSHKVP